jgi:hypothetical protein
MSHQLAKVLTPKLLTDKIARYAWYGVSRLADILDQKD